MMKKKIIVIGAGPAGLAVAGALAQRAVHATVLEKSAQTASSWRRHYERLHLHTVKSHSALPGLPFPADTPRYAPRQAVVDYLNQYADHFSIKPLFGQHVVSVSPQAGNWHITTADNTRFDADAVVVASGANCYPRHADLPAQNLFRGKIVHSDDYRNALPYKGLRVLIVGMGNTGAEIALDLVEQGVTASLSVRSPMNIVRRDVLGRPTQLSSIALAKLPEALGDRIATLLRNLTVGSLQPWGIETASESPLRQLRERGKTPVIDVGTIDRIKAGDIKVYPAITTLTADGARFKDGQEHPFDAILLATGYEAQVGRLFPTTALELDRTGMPVDVVGTGPCSGLFFVGFDIRQPGGLLRTISMQAEQVARVLTADQS